MLAVAVSIHTQLMFKFCPYLLSMLIPQPAAVIYIFTGKSLKPSAGASSIEYAKPGLLQAERVFSCHLILLTSHGYRVHPVL